jgi:hypothetical protein
MDPTRIDALGRMLSAELVRVGEKTIDGFVFNGQKVKLIDT